MKNMQAEFLEAALAAKAHPDTLRGVLDFWHSAGTCDLYTLVEQADFILARDVMWVVCPQMKGFDEAAHDSGAIEKMYNARIAANHAHKAANQATYAKHSGKTEFLEDNAEYWEEHEQNQLDFEAAYNAADDQYDQDRRAILLGFIKV